MADQECVSCHKTLSICPHLKETSQEITYFHGKVRGDFAYINTCFGSNKIICVKEA